MKDNTTIFKIAELAFRRMVEPFIKYPANLEVQIFEHLGTVIIKPRANFADQGKIIGKGKANFNAIKAILDLIGRRNGIHFQLNNLEPATIGSEEFLPPFDPLEDWPSQQTMQDFKNLLDMFLTCKYTVKETVEKTADDEWSTYKFYVPEDEQISLCIGEIGRNLSKIFHAIGKTRGRLLRVGGYVAKAHHAEKIKS